MLTQKKMKQLQY